MTVYSAPVKDMMFLFEHLKDNKNASMIRALLLSAIRSFILWQQSGGTKFRIFLFKKRMAEIALTV